MRTVEIPPYAPILMESTRAIGYSIESAIADIIDNSITAEASEVDINFFPIGESFISILDNGYGMDYDKLLTAMQYGSRNPLDERDAYDLGRYGLGMKTASLSQCRILSVISKRNGSINGAQWNLSHVQKEESWSLIVLDEEEIKQIPSYDKLDKLEHGTLVVWQDLDKFALGETDIAKAFERKMKLIRNHLSLVFHRYLTGEPSIIKLDIRMNNLSIEALDPFLIKKSTQLMDDETIVVRDAKVVVRPFILPHVSKLSKSELDSLGGKDGLRKQQGFYVYRNKRLLVWGTWFRMMRQGDLSKLARVQVDIPNSLDDLWTLDIKKSEATPPEEVRKNLSVVIEKISEGSKRTWTYRGKKETKDNCEHVWNRMISSNGGIYYEINDQHPIIDRFLYKYPDAKKDLELVLSQISKGIPLNSLYLDLTNDEKIENDSENEFKDIKDLLKKILNGMDNLSKDTLIDKLILSDPFADFADEILEAKEKGDFYD